MTSHPARFRLKRHLAGKGYPSARVTGNPDYLPKEPDTRPDEGNVTDNRGWYYLRRMDHDSERTPTREAHKLLSRHHARVSLIVQALLIWGTVAWMVWYLFL